MQDNANLENKFEKTPETFNPAAEAWANVEMPGDEEFMGNQNTSETVDDSSTAPEKSFDEDISNASQILNYANKTSFGAQDTIDKINTFDATLHENSQTELLQTLGIAQQNYNSTTEQYEDLNKIESQRNKDLQNSNFLNNENNSIEPQQKSKNNFENAVSEIKDLVNIVNTSEEYSDLREKAKSAGMGPFDYIVKESPTRDLATLFGLISDFKNKPKNTQENEQKNEQESTEEPVDNDQENKLDSEQEFMQSAKQNNNLATEKEALKNNPEFKNGQKLNEEILKIN